MTYRSGERIESEKKGLEEGSQKRGRDRNKDKLDCKQRKPRSKATSLDPESSKTFND